MSEWWQFNQQSIELAAAVAIISGILFAITHEATKSLMARIKNYFKK